MELVDPLAMPVELAAVSRRAALARLGVGGLGLALAARATTVAAQSATPGAGGCGAKLGAAVAFVGPDGIEVGQLSVDAVTDPFTGYGPNNPPPRGSRFVVVAVTLRNSGAQPWQFDPSALAAQDSDGFLLRPTSVDLGAAPPVSALTGQAVAPGASVQGVVGYAAVKGTALRRVLFMPASDRLLVLAELA